MARLAWHVTLSHGRAVTMREIVRGYTTYFLEEALVSDHFESVALAGEALSEVVEDLPELRNVFEIPDINKRLIKEIIKDIVEKKFPTEAASLLAFMAAAEQQSQFVAVINQLIGEMEALAGMTKSLVKEDKPLFTPDNFASLYLYTFQKYTSYRQARDLMAGYLEPVFEAAANLADLRTVEDSLFAVSNTVNENRELAKVLGDPYVAGKVKLSIVSSLFASRTDPIAYRILRFAVSIPRVRDLAGLIGFCVELITAERGRRLAEVRSVVPLAPEEERQLHTLLERLVGKKVEMRFVIDSNLMGGFVVLLGDYFIDASLLAKFNQLSENLVLSA